MPKVEISIKLTPDEFRKFLTPELRELYDNLVDALIRYGVDEGTAKFIVARELKQVIVNLRE